MAAINKTYDLYVWRHNNINIQIVSQENKSRIIKFNLLANELNQKALDSTFNGSVVHLYINKGNKKPAYVKGTLYADSSCEFTLDSSCCPERGHYDCFITITSSDGAVLKISGIKLCVANGDTSNYLISTSQLDAFAQLLVDVENLKKQISGITNNTNLEVINARKDVENKTYSNLKQRLDTNQTEVIDGRGSYANLADRLNYLETLLTVNNQEIETLKQSTIDRNELITARNGEWSLNYRLNAIEMGMNFDFIVSATENIFNHKCISVRDSDITSKVYSHFIKCSAEDILYVYKQDDTGLNLYPVDVYVFDNNNTLISAYKSSNGIISHSNDRIAYVKIALSPDEVKNIMVTRVQMEKFVEYVPVIRTDYIMNNSEIVNQFSSYNYVTSTYTTVTYDNDNFQIVNNEEVDL